MRELAYVVAISASAMAWLTWNQPGALLALAGMVERGMKALVWRMRVRAFAKQAANHAYARAVESYKELAS